MKDYVLKIRVFGLFGQGELQYSPFCSFEIDAPDDSEAVGQAEKIVGEIESQVQPGIFNGGVIERATLYRFLGFRRFLWWEWPKLKTVSALRSPMSM